MKLSTKGRYGLRALVDLAVYSEGQHVPLKNIAKRQDISENYLEQVFSSLRKTGIVKSIKGAQGGYVLSVKSAELKVGTILRALEGSISVIDVDEDDSSDKNIIKQCIKASVWDRINERINDLVDSITLEDLVNEYKQINESRSPMFYI